MEENANPPLESVHTEETKQQPISQTQPEFQSLNSTIASFQMNKSDHFKPLWIATLSARHPCLMCGVIFFLIFGISAYVGTVFQMSENNDRAWLVESNDFVKKFDSLQLAKNEITSAVNSSRTKPQTQQQDAWTYTYMFKLVSYGNDLDSSTDYWILTPENIETIIEYENMIYADTQWRNYFCLVNSTSDDYNCDFGVKSLAREIAESYNYNYSAMRTDDVKSYVKQRWSDSIVQSHFNPEFVETNQTYMYRSFYSAGLPTPTNITNTSGGLTKKSEYLSESDNYDVQYENYVNGWAFDITKNLVVKEKGKKKDSGLHIVVMCYDVISEYFNILLGEATAYMLGAIVMVFLYMTFHLRSAFMAAFGLLEILLSFPLAYLFYGIVCQIDYFEFLNTLIIFVLLGVGADDIFVFTDAWHQSKLFVENVNDLEARMNYSYRRAAKAMLVTQVTTFFAFIATSASPLMPISAFGYWAAFVIACNYLLVITVYPPALIIWETYIKRFEHCTCCRSKRISRDTTNDVPHDTEGEDNVELAIQARRASVDHSDGEVSVEERAVDYRPFERFMGIQYSKFVIKYRLFILAFFTIVFGLSIWAATLIEEQTETESWFEDDHWISIVLNTFDSFSSGEEDGLVTVNLFWGISGVDRSGSDKWDPTDYGSTVWDESFDMSSPEAQLHIMEACTTLRNDQTLVYDSDTSVTCPLSYLPAFLTSEYGASFPYVYLDSSNYTYVYNGSTYGSVQIHDGVDYNATQQKIAFGQMMFNYSQSDHGSHFYTYGYYWPYFDTTQNMYIIRYITADFKIPLSFSDDVDIALSLQSGWTQWVKDYNTQDCPTGVCDLQQTAWRWCWLATRKAFVRSAIQGIAIAMPLAFCVLILSTQNWIMAIFATLDIIGVMLCELGVMAAQQWRFGISESVSIVIIIGFSVDYVVHLAHAYLESPNQTRNERLSFSLLTMGISVCSGAITTFLAGIFLLFPDMIFFKKMGVLIMSTIALSLFWSMTFFCALLATFGPQHKQGYIPLRQCYTAVRNKIPFLARNRNN